MQQNLLLPFAMAQGRVACALAGTEPDAVFVGLSCTGADPIALVLASVLAFPVTWRERLRGCAFGVALIVALNTARIGTLSLVVGSKDLFNLLHVYLWPALLIIAAAAYVFRWMGASLRRPVPELGQPAARLAFSRAQTIRFAALLSLFVAAFYAAAPWLMRSQAVLEAARWATLAAAGAMKVFGVPVEAAGNLLRTPHGTWVVTQACIATPLLPVYLAAVAVLPISRTRRSFAAFMALPLFLLLGSARLLVLALPAAALGSHATAIHAFYQVLAAGAVVSGAAWLSASASTAAGRARIAVRALAVGAASGLAIGALTRVLVWPVLEGVGSSAHLGHAYNDPQGALGLMPAFCFGFLAALQVALRRPLWSRSTGLAAAGLAVSLAFAQIAAGELASHISIEPPIVAVRALALGLPLLLSWLTSPRQPSAVATVLAGGRPA